MSSKAFTPHHLYRPSSVHKPLTRKSGGGFTLIEILIAITVITLGIVGFYAAITRVASLTFSNSSRFVASRLAQEGIELVTNIRDTNWIEQTTEPTNPWNEGLTDCSTGCEADYNTPTVEDPILTPYGEGRYLRIDDQGFYSYNPTGAQTKFKRKITITPDTDILKVKVQITWPGKGSPLEVEEHLYNWK